MEAHLEGMNLYCSHRSEPPLMLNFEHNLNFIVLAYIKYDHNSSKNHKQLSFL